MTCFNQRNLRRINVIETIPNFVLWTSHKDYIYFNTFTHKQRS